MTRRTRIPGIVRPTEAFRSTDRKSQPKTIEEKRQTVIRTIERYRRGEKGAATLEHYDSEQKAPVIRLLYGSAALPIFDGKPAAIIDPKTDRDALWDAITAEIEAGAFDEAIEQVSQALLKGLNEARERKARAA